MNWQGYATILGTLAVAIGLIVGGIAVHVPGSGGWGIAMIIAGSAGLIAWLFFIFDLGTALNSDR